MQQVGIIEEPKTKDPLWYLSALTSVKESYC